MVYFSEFRVGVFLLRRTFIRRGFGYVGFVGIWFLKLIIEGGCEGC